jgi:hypothetical protein
MRSQGDFFRVEVPDLDVVASFSQTDSDLVGQEFRTATPFVVMSTQRLLLWNQLRALVEINRAASVQCAG